MCDNENQNEELTPFEQSLGELRPRADGLDRRMRFLLAQEAALNYALIKSGKQVDVQPICVHCGSPLSNAKARKQRWAWPTAFSGMTAVAVILFAMLLIRNEAQNTMMGDQQHNQPSMATAVQGQMNSFIVWPDRNTHSSASCDSTSYLNLRDQVLRFGVESWKMPVAAVSTGGSGESPLNYRNQLNQLLKQDPMHGI